jgi:hypothetical protein
VTPADIAGPDWWRDPLTVSAIFIGVIAALTVVSLIVNVLLWRTARKAANAATSAAEAANKSANAATQQAEASRKSLEIGAALNRPYMGISKFERVSDRNSSLWVVLWVIKNFGSLPAMKVNASIETSSDGTNFQADRATESAEMFPQTEVQTRTVIQFEDVRPIIEGEKIVSGRIRISYEAPNGQRFEFSANIRYEHSKDRFTMDSETRSL